ncbi:MAG TPA: hypothetical protein VHU40_13990 [Polyangia bacterium]|jgi:hypothetical protein|nr:hypothetical protein [Polyangia bacterium]
MAAKGTKKNGGDEAGRPGKAASVANAAKSAKAAIGKLLTKPNKPAKAAKSKVPFPKKNQPPSDGEFVARLPLPVGKKFETIRTYLKKQKDVTEDLYFYGPKTGWAYRYRHGPHSLATMMIHGDRLVGIVALDAATLSEIDFTALSEVGERARRLAHGSPALSWFDLPLDGTGAADFKALLKAKLANLPAPPAAGSPPPPPPPPARSRAR